MVEGDEELSLHLGALDGVGAPDEIAVVSYSDAGWASCSGYWFAIGGILIAIGVLC